MRIFTIGFTKTNARNFFEELKRARVRRLIDVRLNNVSQLAGFAKRDDLAYFLETICSIDYIHLPKLAPTKDILNKYKKMNGDWRVYEEEFRRLMEVRQIENIDRDIFHDACLLCSEASPQHCHRRLVAEYLKEKWGDVEISHLRPKAPVKNKG